MPNSARMTCFSTRSKAPQITEAAQSSAPKAKPSLADSCPSVRATTVSTAQATPAIIMSHSSSVESCMRPERPCSTAVASGMHARIT